MVLMVSIMVVSCVRVRVVFFTQSLKLLILAELTMELLPEVKLTTDEQKVSYGFGLQFGEQLLRNKFEGMDIDAVTAGIQHWFNNQRGLLTDEELNPSYQIIQERQKAIAAEVAGKRQQLADQFMVANAARDEVTTTASGLQYEVLEAGTGSVSPQSSSTVVTHYHGTFVDGSIFDSSVDRGEPAEFGVGQVISGWTEALQLMTEGDKWRIACPPALAYGEQGAGDSIPPNTALVFEIHLISIKS
jgi:FKBP-type peptidyl-prolyl cis-trans isomerase FklB